MIFESVMAGFGGQGILSAGMMLAHIASHKGLNVTWFPSYGAEQRGGTANCTVVISDLEIGSPIVTAPAYGLIMNMPSFNKFQPRFRKGAKAVLDTSLVDPSAVTRTDVEFYGLNAGDIARDLGNVRVANMVMIGGLLAVSGLFTLEEAVAELPNALSKKHHDLIPLNEQALSKGFSEIKKINK
ncbi:MAG: 2-oxoacid:acceptor oxidoreductase family protein [Geovibrio sp.]|uniref:2-oxoacid:acceptor oxidoreductase family protein n=1 Tax=Geovibrio ferrireducens TaxID=46201 RepID=UPI0022473AF3|nr:2-oxoacid:acceptor oxidoreductase family protein [Geovibrio ferrireducens]MCD8568075.1 2-oxoacid:acceptor oxidoreductase family protein [Geovibrio sp.]